jgi:hypothetical protein
MKVIHPDVDADPLDAEVSLECDCGRIILARLRALKDGTLVPCQCGEAVSSDLDEFVTHLEDIELQLARGFSSLRRAMHAGSMP